MKQLLVFLIGITSFQNQPDLKKVDNKELSNVINSIEFFNEYSTNLFSVRLLIIDNEPGSANFQGTGEISSYILIGISEFDEFPVKTLYKLDNIINPSIIDEENLGNSLVIKIRYRSNDNFQSGTLVITNKGVEFQ